MPDISEFSDEPGKVWKLTGPNSISSPGEDESATPATDLIAAITANIDTIAPTLANLMANLGGKREWSMEDNFYTTERIAELAGQVTGHSAGDQSDDDLRFWHPIALELGYSPDELPVDETDDDDDACLCDAILPCPVHTN